MKQFLIKKKLENSGIMLPNTVLEELENLDQLARTIQKDIVFQTSETEDGTTYWGINPRLILSDFPPLLSKITTLPEARRYAKSEAFESPASFFCWRISRSPSVVIELPRELYRQTRERDDNINVSFHSIGTPDTVLFDQHWRERFPAVWKSYVDIFGVQEPVSDGLERYMILPVTEFGMLDPDVADDMINRIAKILRSACERAICSHNGDASEKIGTTREAACLLPLQVAKRLNLLKCTEGKLRLGFMQFCRVFEALIGRYDLQFSYEKEHRINSDLFFDKLGPKAVFGPEEKNQTKARKRITDFVADLEAQIMEVINNKE